MSRRRADRGDKPAPVPAPAAGPPPPPVPVPVPVTAPLPPAPLWEWCAAAGCALLALVLYLPTLDHEYTLDDLKTVRENPTVTGGRYRDAVAKPWWPDQAGRPVGASNWRPLATLSLTMERAIAPPPETNPAVERTPAVVTVPGLHHADNAFLHALLVLLCFPLARRLAGPGWPAIAACALFAVHPAHVEAVANVVARCDLLAGLGAAGALLAFVRAREEPTRAPLWLAVGATAYAVGLGGKESAGLLIVLLPLVDWWWRGTPVARLVEWPWFRAYLPFAAVAVVYLGLRIAVLGEFAFSHAQDPTGDLFERIPGAFRNIVVSAGLLVAPVDVHHILTTVPSDSPYAYPAPAGLEVPLWMLAGLPFYLGWVLLVRRAPRAAFLWFAAVAFWFPTSGFLRTGSGTALRFLLLPSAFAAFALAAGAAELVGRRPAWRLPVGVGLAVLALAGALRTWHTVPVWKNNGTFYHAVLAEKPESYTAAYGLGAWYGQQVPPPVDEARAWLRKAMAIAGDGPAGYEAHMNLAILLEHAPNGVRGGPGAPLDEAIAEYRRLLPRDPQRWEGHWNLARLLDAHGDGPGALEAFEASLRRHPGNPQGADAHFRCGKLSDATGNPARAMAHYREVAARLPADHALAIEARQRIAALGG